MEWARSLFVKNARLYSMIFEDTWTNGEKQARLLSKYLVKKGYEKCNVLDIPCGIGRISMPLARLGFSVVGIDLSPYFVSMAKEKSTKLGESKRPSFLVGEMKHVDSYFHNKKFDVAISVETCLGYGSVRDDLTFFKRLKRIVKRGGIYVITNQVSKDYLTSHFARNLYDETKRLIVLQTNELDEQRSKLNSKWRFYVKEKGLLKFAGESSFNLHLYSPRQLCGLLETAGWKIQSVFNSLSSQKDYSIASRTMTIVARNE